MRAKSQKIVRPKEREGVIKRKRRNEREWERGNNPQLIRISFERLGKSERQREIVIIRKNKREWVTKPFFLIGFHLR